MAQTYTHLFFSAAVVSALLPDHLGTQAAFVGASVVSDLVTFGPDSAGVCWRDGPLVAFRALPAQMKKQTPAVMLRKEISHSLLLWGIVCMLLLPMMIYPRIWWLFSLPVALFLHALIDVFTHGRGDPDEPTYSWPAEFRLGDLCGFCNYVIGKGIIRPKPVEAVIDVVAVVVAIYFQWDRILALPGLLKWWLAI